MIRIVNRVLLLMCFLMTLAIGLKLIGLKLNERHNINNSDTDEDKEVESSEDVTEDNTLPSSGITEELSQITQNIIPPVSMGTLSDAIEKPKFEEYYMYTKCFVNLRDDSSLEANILDEIMPNVEVKVIGVDSEWSHVVLNETAYGYIKSEYLSPDKTAISSLNRWGIELTDEEINLLSRIVYLEAHIEPLMGKEAVVEVVFNRMAFSSYFKGDLYSVLSREGQFSTWDDIYNPVKCKPSLDEYQAIYNVLYGKTHHLEPEYVYFATYQANGHDFIQIGRHWFGKE